RHAVRRRVEGGARTRGHARCIGLQPVESISEAKVTPAREAVVLPLVFITVGALGGLRVAEQVRLLPPPLVSLVLSVLLMGTLVRSGVFAPERLMSGQRSALENANGLVVLVTLFAASAQVFTLLIPDIGLLHAVFGIALFVQLVTSL